ncbi:MAG TPA: hypothetical protein VMS64_10755, partial [Candidatus Methylomirabilis sp.]|nr:hypothetical protein [Candidatus Methylomirabilis sp.]
NALDPTQAVDFDTVKAANFGTATERLNLKTLNAKRLAFRYVLFAHNLVGNPSGGNNGSGCSEIGGDDGVVSLGSFATTTVSSVSHARGTTDQQAGTFMHEFGHLLGFGHGGSDNVNCKPNYRSVMSYSRQFAGSPIPNRRLDYSRSADPVLADINKTGFLDKSNLSEGIALGTDPSRGPIPPYFPQADIIVFGPNAWSIATATAASIDWNRSKTTNTGGVSANINSGATSGCDGSGGNILEGQDDWSSVLYRPSAAINFAGGVTPSAEMTSDDEEAFYSARDADANGVGDNFDCGGHVLANGTSAFPCTHRLDVPKGIKPTGNFEIVIFSERNGLLVWYAPLQVLQDSTLTVSLESVVIPVKTKGNGTCAAKDMPDPTTGKRDGIKDLHCQVHVTGTPLPTGTVFATVSGFFFDPLTFQLRAFSAREEVTIAP